MEKAAYVFRQECLSLTNKVGLYQATFQYVPSHLQVFFTGQRGGVRVTDGCSVPYLVTGPVEVVSTEVLPRG